MGLREPLEGQGRRGRRHGSPVAHALGARAVRLHDDEHVLEVRADAPGCEGKRPRLLEDDGDDVIPDVSLPQELRPGGTHNVRAEPGERAGEMQ